MNKIESELREWFAYMQSKYTWLTIKYEYSEERGCYLVSFSPTSEISQDWSFCDEAMDFALKLDEEYGDLDAPLFCNDERLFRLSDKAIVLPSKDNSILMDVINLTSAPVTTTFKELETIKQDSQSESILDEASYYNYKNIAA